MNDVSQRNRRYWNQVADPYQAGTQISLTDFHYGPLLPGDGILQLLPHSLQGLRCLEIGCGAGQNSIVLAGRGATCTALDISEAQIAHGRSLADAAGADVDFCVGDMDALPVQELGAFDLVHSTYALPFAERPERCMRAFFELVRPGGMLLLTTAHPVYSGEWAELTSGEEGVVLTNYFDPPPDSREPESGHQGVTAAAVPLSTTFTWLREAGFSVDRFEEPSPLPVDAMSAEDLDRDVPYYSESWQELYDVLSCIPVVAIFRCIRPIND